MHFGRRAVVRWEGTAPRETWLETFVAANLDCDAGLHEGLTENMFEEMRGYRSCPPWTLVGRSKLPGEVEAGRVS